ncbi:MAG: response regulator transcription factor [Thiothrix sp.]|uniref:response regulator n=1 Tax=Thiothrix sp. TaxID=1032 RepID=UPI002613A17F|nr:response regulator transcription factor [Thiothrix sp.]MDD5391490.1 response regulator transcription factor [Thiothrix sp.]
MPTLLIVDDHLLFMEGLSLVLKMREPAFKLLQANTLELAKQQIKHHSVDLILLDRTLPGTDSLQHLQAFWDVTPTVRIVMISAADSPRYIREALDAGAAGFIPKTVDPNIMVAAIKRVLTGGIYIPEHFYRQSKETPLLTPRQQEIMGLAATGQTNKQIAQALNLTEGTVKVHFNSILKLLSATNRTQAVQRARLLGLIT